MHNSGAIPFQQQIELITDEYQHYHLTNDGKYGAEHALDLCLPARVKSELEGLSELVQALDLLVDVTFPHLSNFTIKTNPRPQIKSIT